VHCDASQQFLYLFDLAKQRKASTPADLSTTMASPNARNPSKITVSNLTGDHLSTFENVLSSILSTDLAQLTYSQIIDGLPVRDVWNAYACRRSDIDEHVEPCSEAIEVWKAFRDSFQSHTLQFASRTVQGYQNTTPGTKDFNVRLLELVAVACHDTAALLYQIAKGGVGKHAERSPGPTILHYDGVPYPPIPTDFYHTEYRDWEQYPQGVADMVGYWAEFELFGGVVLFDRGDSEVVAFPFKGGGNTSDLPQVPCQRFVKLLVFPTPPFSEEIPAFRPRENLQRQFRELHRK
jgi:hypothetical protein